MKTPIHFYIYHRMFSAYGIDPTTGNNNMKFFNDNVLKVYYNQGHPASYSNFSTNSISLLCMI